MRSAQLEFADSAAAHVDPGLPGPAIVISLITSLLLLVGFAVMLVVLLRP